jgi:hypothetical protein
MTNVALAVIVIGTVSLALAVDVAVVIEWLNTKRRLR